MPFPRHRERHNSQHSGWLRAAVLGANDGTISVSSLAVGIASAGVGREALLVSTLAAIVAGAMSMATGEFVSVQSQADTEAADLARERQELANDPAGELEELTEIYRRRGLEAALADAPDEVVVFGAASEAFSQRNINCSIEESITRFAPVVAGARDAGIKVRGAVSVAMGCPYQGEVSADEVERVVRLMKSIGVEHCGIADTIGVATPVKTQAAMERALKHFPLHEVSGHFHDTYGQALANILTCLHMGIHLFDTSIAGLGGCPYAKGATGNVATEDVVFMLHGMGIETGIDLDALIDAGVFISQALGRQPNSLVARAVLNKRSG